MNRPVLIGLYGTSNTGKTTLIKEMISWLTSKGFNVASVKKTDHEYQLDSPGKDTFVYGQAGSYPVIFSSVKETTFIMHHGMSEEEIINKLLAFRPVDVIFIEGSQHPTVPKVQMDKDSKKRHHTIWQYDGTMNFIKKYVLQELDKRKQNMNYKTMLKVNGKKIGLTEFPEEIIQNTILAMVSSLKGVEDIQTVELSLDKINKE